MSATHRTVVHLFLCDQAQTYTAESERASARNVLYRSVQQVLLGAIDFVTEAAATSANAATSTPVDSRQRLMRELTVGGWQTVQGLCDSLADAGSRCRLRHLSHARGNTLPWVAGH